MLNTWNFTLLAGKPAKWDAEFTEKNIAPGVRFNMTELQREQHERGRRSAELVHGPRGWSVHYASSLDNYAPIPGEAFIFTSRKLAVAAGKRWANADPDHREFFARNDHLDPNKYADDGTPINTGEEL
jgi:hypothetical protein